MLDTLAPPTPHVLRRARVALFALFLLAGTAVGTWTSRIPAVKSDLALSEAGLSVALLGIAAGAIVGMQVVGRVVDRYGSRRAMIPAAILSAFVLILPSFATGMWSLALTLFVFGVVHGVLDVSMNANAVVVEIGYGRPVMSAFHAVYSVGGVLGAATGGLFAHLGADVRTTYLAGGVLIALPALLAAWWALPSAYDPGTRGHDGPEPKRPLGAGVLFLGVLAFCVLVGEGAAADWSSVYLVESLGSSAAVGAVAFAAFSTMMMAGRFAGDRLAARFGGVPLVRVFGTVAGVGLLAGLLVDTPVAGIIGFALFGGGLSLIIPQVFSAAGHRDPAQSGRALARVAGLGYIGFLAGPVIIGGLATVTSLPIALGVPAIMALFVAFAAPALRPRK